MGTYPVCYVCYYHNYLRVPSLLHDIDERIRDDMTARFEMTIAQRPDNALWKPLLN
jgi:hypothetical protein